MHPLGLLKLKKDSRDFSHHKIFGSVALSDLPLEFSIATPQINNQGTSDFCPGESTSEAAEDFYNETFSPEYSFAKIKEILGNWQQPGADLRTAMKAGIKYGFCPQNLAPLNLASNGRDQCANPANWPLSCDLAAGPYKFGGFLAVDGPGDTFSNIQNALFTQKMAVVAGSNWYADWEQDPGGIIPKTYSILFSTLHATNFFGWKQINGQPYLMLQNSEGEDVGDRGIYYFPRSVVNKEFNDGLFYFVKQAPSNIQTVGNWLQILIESILRLF